MKTREELLAEMQDHFKRLSELLDHLDRVLPEHAANEQLKGEHND